MYAYMYGYCIPWCYLGMGPVVGPPHAKPPEDRVNQAKTTFDHVAHCFHFNCQKSSRELHSWVRGVVLVTS